MKRLFLSVLIFFISTVMIFPQGFKVKATGTQAFSFEDKLGRNQATFSSSAPLENFTGTANGINGTVSFNVNDFAKTLKGKIIVAVNSINTGIELRNHHLQSANWLNASKYQNITFEIKSASDVKQTADNKLEFKVTGNLTIHGVTKQVTVDAEATYLDESNQTKTRGPGDLLGIHADFNVKLSDYDIDNNVIGSKVAENVGVKVNIVGSNKF